MAKEISVKREKLLFDVVVYNEFYNIRAIYKNITIANTIQNLKGFNDGIKKTEKSGGKLFHNVSLFNKLYNINTVYTEATLQFLVDSLDKLDGKTKVNAKDATKVKGSSKNSKTVKPEPNMTI
jgi:hypothetical protein